MPKLRVHGFTISVDGYGAGPNQDRDHPLGVGGMALHEWAFATRTFRRMFGGDGGTAGIDDDFAARGFENIGAWILGRNMFGPLRGEWPDDSWKGWWGDDPPYQTDVFVLTHHARQSVPMEGGTTFHFVTDGIERALERATAAADGKDVGLWGGARIIDQYLAAGLVDELELHIAPVVLGGGARLFEGAGPGVRLEQIRTVGAPGVTHVKYRVTG
jgi:dihydrofolate reductase